MRLLAVILRGLYREAPLFLPALVLLFGLAGGAYGGTLTNVFTAVNTNILTRAPSGNMTFQFKVYKGATPYTTGNGYYAHVYDRNTNNVDTLFEISLITFVTDHFEVNIKPRYNAVVEPGYFIGVGKNAGGDGETMDERFSKADLGAAGLLEVTYAPLTVFFMTNSRYTTARGADYPGRFTYQYRVLYPDGSSQESQEPENYQIKILGPDNADVSSQFDIDPPVYYTNRWYLDVLPRSTAAVTNGFYLSLLKVSNDTLQLVYSTNATNMGGLGPVNGYFGVTNAVLSLLYSNISRTSLERGSPSNSTVTYRVYYPNGLSQETNDTGYTVRVLDKTGADASIFFDIGTPYITNSGWAVDIKAKAGALADTNYQAAVSKAAGGGGDVLAEKTTPADLLSQGYFSVTGAQLTAAFISNTRSAAARADGVGTVYMYRIYYKDGSSQETNDTGYAAKILNAASADVTAQFTLGAPYYSNGSWNLQVIPRDTAVIATGYKLQLTKTAASKPDTMGTMVSTGVTFAVTNALLSASWSNRSLSLIPRADSSGTLYRYRVYYPDGVTEETSDTGYMFTVYDKNGIDRTSWFDPGTPVYSSGYWQVAVKSRPAAVTDTGYFLGLTKLAGTSGDTMSESRSTNLLLAAGSFGITNAGLTITFSNRDKSYAEQSDGTGVLYTWKVYYPDTLSEETNDAANYSVKVYDSLNADVTAQFSVTAPVYTTSRWQGRVIPLQNTAVASGYKIGVSKPVSDVLPEERANVDLGASGLFSVSNTTLSAVFTALSNVNIGRGGTNGAVFYYNAFYKDGTTPLTNDALSFVVKVYDGAVDVTSNFQVAQPVYGGGGWSVMIKALTAAAVKSNMTIGLSKTAGSTGETMAEERATNDLGTAGFFHVNNAFLSITYLSRSASFMERADGTGITYNYRVTFENSSEETAATDYQVKIYNAATNDITAQFSITPPYYSNTQWYLKFRALRTAPVGGTNLVGISKAGGVGTLLEELSDQDLGYGGGAFAVSNTILSATFITNLKTAFARADGTGTTFRYRVFYKDGTTEETTDSGYVIKLLDGTYTDITSDYTLNGPLYTNGYWQVQAIARTWAVTGTGYTLSVLKNTGGGGDTLVEKRASTDLGASGLFSVTNALLNLVFSNRSAPQLSRTDTTNGIVYTYRAFYPDGSSEETNQTGYNVKIYLSGADVSGDFTILTPVYSNGAWNARVLGKTNSSAGNGFYMSVNKTTGDTAQLKYSTNTLGMTNGAFDLTDLRVLYLSASPTNLDRGSSNSIRFCYQIYDDVNTERTNGNGYFVKVYNQSLSDVSSNFVISAPFYLVDRWCVDITIKTGAAILPGYSIAVCKTNAGDGSVLKERLATEDLGAGGGSFSVTPGVLHMKTVARSPSYFQKVDGSGVLYQYTIVYADDVTEETGDTGYAVTVYNEADADVTSQFNLTGPVYLGGFWTVRVQARSETTVGSNFYIGVVKLPGGKGDTMALTKTTNVRFNLTEAVLSMVWSNRSPSVFNRADGRGTTYRYRVYYPDGVTLKTNGDSYQVSVYDQSGADKTSRFLVSTPVFGSGYWSVNVQALQMPGVIEVYTNYYLGLSKLAGTDGDTLPQSLSTNNGLGTNGMFWVGNLRAEFSNRAPASIERSDGTGVVFRYRVYYPDGSQETSDTAGYSIKVFISNQVDVSAQFTVLTPVYSTDHWTVTVKALANTPALSNYYLGLVKNSSATNAILYNEYSTNTLLTAGMFHVVPATLTAVFSNRTVPVFERADGTGTLYTYRVFYDDGVTQETNDSGYSVKVRNLTNLDVSSQFVIGTPVYTGGSWRVQVQSLDTTSVLTNYRLTVTKTAGGKGDTLAESYSTNGLGDNGQFAVTNASLNIVFATRNISTIEQASSTNVVYTYRVYYDNMTTQETSDSGYSLRLIASGGADASSSFVLTNLGYSGGYWRVRVFTKDLTPVQAGYNLAVSKGAGSKGDSFAEKNATNDLGAAGGSFAVTDATLSMVYISRTSGSFQRADNTGTTYIYRVFYGNTNYQLTNDAASFTVKALDSGNNDVSSLFALTTPVYTNSGWHVNVQAYNHTPIANNFRLSVQKAAGTSGDTLAARISTNDLGAAGTYNVTYNSNLSVVFETRDRDGFERADGTGVNYSFRVFYPDGTELTNGSIAGTVYNAALADVSAQYLVSVPVYTNGHWYLNAQAFAAAVTGSNLTLGVTKTAGDVFALERSDADLGAGGRFRLSNATLNITFLSNSRAFMYRADGVGMDAYFRVYYDDLLTEETNDVPYQVKVYNRLGADVTSTFIISAPVYTAGGWKANLIADTGAELTTNYTFTVSKAANSTGDTLAAVNVTNGLGLGGMFDVINEPQLHIQYLSRSVPAFRRTDPAGLTFSYRVFYQDNISQETNDSGYVVKVYDIGTNDITSSFSIGAPVYTNARWWVKITGGLTTPVLSNFFVGISKLPGGSGDSMNEEYSLVDLGDTGYFHTADLRIVYTARTNAVIVRADNKAVRYYFRLYEDDGAVEVTNAADLSARVYDAATNDVTVYFTVSNLSYSASDMAYRADIWSRTNTAALSNYFISVSKGYAGGHSLIEEESRVDLGNTDGVFEVTPAVLSLVFQGRTVTGFQKADGAGTVYSFKAFYPNGDEETFDRTAYAFKVYDRFNADRTTRFYVTNLGYTSGSWKANVQARISAASDINYTLSVSKNPGLTGDTLAEKRATNDLSTAGFFEVRNATLHISYIDHTNSVFERSDGVGTTYYYRTLFGDDVTEETADAAFYTITVFTTNRSNFTSYFTTENEYMTNLNCWRATVKALDSCPPRSDYTVEIIKTNSGSTGSTLAVLPDLPELATQDLGATNGVFTVTYATLNAFYSNRDGTLLTRGGTNKVTYRYRVLYDDLFTHENNDSGYSFKIYDSNGVEQTSNFTVTNRVYSYPVWNVHVFAKGSAAPGSNYTLSVSKTTGGEGDTLDEKRADSGDILPLEDARFAVAPASLRCFFTWRNTNRINRASTNNVMFRFRLVYDDDTELTSGSGIVTKVYDSSGLDVSSLFSMTAPVYTNGAWEFTTAARPEATNAPGYYVSIEKSGGLTSDSFALRYSTNDLGAAGGVFDLYAEPRLSILYTSLVPLAIEQGTNTVTYRFKLLYEDGVSQLTNDSGFVVNVYNRLTNQVASSTNAGGVFDIAMPVYEVSNWVLVLTGQPATPTNTGYFVGISKLPGGMGDTLTEEYSTLDLGQDGAFNVDMSTAVSLLYTARSPASIDKRSGSEVRFDYRILLDAGGEITADDGFTFKVYDKNGVDRSSWFVFTTNYYDTASWALKLKALPEAVCDTNYYVSISKTPGLSTYPFSEKASYFDLGRPGGVFAVIPSGLALDYRLLEKTNLKPMETNVVLFRILYPDSNTQLTNGVTAGWISVYDRNTNNVTSRYIVTNVRYDVSNWSAVILARYGYGVSDSNFLSIGGTSPLGDTVDPEYSTLDLLDLGRFDITGTSLVVRFIEIGRKTIKPADPESVTFRVYYPDLLLEVTNGVRAEQLDILDKNGRSLLPWFPNPELTYHDGYWEYRSVTTSDAPGGRFNYYTISGVIDSNVIIPDSTTNQLGQDRGTFIIATNEKVYQNYPNPFDPAVGVTTFVIDSTDESAELSVRIYTLTGNLVRTLSQGSGISERHQVQWDGRNDSGVMVASGIYYAVIRVGASQTVVKVLVARR